MKAAAVACAALGAALLPPVPFALADDTSLYAGPVDGERVLSMVVDTGAASLVEVRARAPFLPAAWRDRGGCRSGRVYWRRGGGAPPPCESTHWVAAEAPAAHEGQRCAAALVGLRARGWSTHRGLVQWSPEERRWLAPRAGARAALECADDDGRHGERHARAHAADGDDWPWSAAPEHAIAWLRRGDVYTLYTAEFVAWWHGAPLDAARTHAAAQMEALATLPPLAPSVTALWRHDWRGGGSGDGDAEGGALIALAAPGLLPAWPADEPRGGPSPLAETLYESVLWLSGGPVEYGASAQAPPGTPRPSIAAARSGAPPSRYASPLTKSCARTTLVALPADPPTADHGATARWARYFGTGAPPASASSRPFDCSATSSAPCLETLRTHLAQADVGPPRGIQSADLHVVRMGDEAALPPALAARLLGWHARPLAATPWSTSFQPSGSSARGTALYVGLLQPARGDRWLGDVRRHTLQRLSGSVVAIDGRTGHLDPADGLSFASQLPSPAARRLYTDRFGPDLTAPDNALSPDNARLGADALGLGATEPDPAARGRAADTLLRWLRGADVDDTDGDGDRAEPRREIGAVASRPVVLETVAGVRTVFTGTGDGFLHAFDDAGRERWAYVPGVLLEGLAALREKPPLAARSEGIGGEPRLHLVERDPDGRLDAARGERALLLFGLRRGGRAYVALDVTDVARPRHLWTLTPRELRDLGETWPSPVVAQLAVGGARQNASRRVVLLAGGYDPALDRALPRARDRLGAALHLVDADSGERLWTASADAGADLVVPLLRYAIAATPRAVDLDGDGELDAAYVADTGGQLWRFRFESGQPRGTLARATRLAALGGGGAADRRFHAEPDAALVTSGPGAPYVAVTLGSGAAGAPLDLARADRVYGIRDRLDTRLRPLDPAGAVTDAELPEAGAPGDDGAGGAGGPGSGPGNGASAGGDAAGGRDAASARGWKRSLRQRGEKILVGTRTVDHVVYAVSYTPADPPLDASCARRPGTTRLHALDVRSGRAVDPRRASTAADAGPEPAALELALGGGAPALDVAVARPAPGCTTDCGIAAVGLVGTERVPIRWPGRLVRTGWAEREVE